MTILKLPLFELNDKAEGKGAAADARPMALWLGCVGSAEPCRGGAVFELLCAGAAFFVGPEAGQRRQRRQRPHAGARLPAHPPPCKEGGRTPACGEAAGAAVFVEPPAGAAGAALWRRGVFCALVRVFAVLLDRGGDGLPSDPGDGAARGACGIRRGARCAESGVFPERRAGGPDAPFPTACVGYRQRPRLGRRCAPFGKGRRAAGV